MYLDARQLPAGASIEADVCIVGAGPAGLTLASRLIDRGLHVLVLESGADGTDETVLSLNRGAVVGDRYAGLAATRHRRIGGTTAIWNTTVRGEVGAKYVPLDPVDFARRPRSVPRGWPLRHEDLAPYYDRAIVLCGLDAGPSRGTEATVPRLAAPLVPGLYHFGTRRRLLDPLLDKLGGADSRLCYHATALEIDASGSEAKELAFSTPDGARGTVHAARFVLAAGAVENARLLLLSARRPPEFGNEGDWVGRCFMEHPRDTSITFQPHSPRFYREAGYYDVHDGPRGGPRLGRLGLEAEALRSDGLPNVSGTLLPVVRAGVRKAAARLGRAAGRPPLSTLLPTGGHGWSAHRAPSLVYEGMMILLNIEQTPHPENRVRLGDARDALGMRRAELHWRLRPDDRAGIDRLRRTFARALRASNVGEVHLDEAAGVDPNAHHHAGTTRMSSDPRYGVVDRDLRVHGMENLFVAGASVFPTAGYANPLLTIVALSLRLGDHL
ncbi:MAG: GMC oxidoreductase [Gemmatimonadota bacterium]